MITVFTGENSFAISRAVKDTTAMFDGDVERYDGLEIDTTQLPDLLMGATLFSKKRMIVLRGVTENKTLWTELEKWVERSSEDTSLILIEPRPDKRTKTYKLLQKHATIHVHDMLPEHSLVAWLIDESHRQGFELSHDSAKYLVSYVGHDQWRLSSELGKLLLSGKPIDKKSIQDITEPHPEVSAFELLDSVFSGRSERAEELLDILREREDPYMFFGLLSSQVFALLALVHAGSRRPDDIAKDVGIHPFVVKKLAPIASKLGKARVNLLVEKLAVCDERIKTTGAEPWSLLRRTLLSTIV